MNTLCKIASYEQQMAASGVGRSTASPPAWRMLWHLGVQVPPPLFLGFLPLLLILGSTFGLLFGLGIWLLQAVGFVDFSLVSIPVRAAFAGLFFGLFMAAYYRNLARKHNLGSWASYSGASERT